MNTGRGSGASLGAAVGGSLYDSLDPARPLPGQRASFHGFGSWLYFDMCAEFRRIDSVVIR